MYAAKGNSRVYHYVRPKSGKTYCGLNVSRLLLDRPAGLSLHLVKDKPAGRTLCQHCAKIEKSGEYSESR